MVYFIHSVFILHLQTYGQSDKASLKCYVFVAWLFDTIHEVFLLNANYVYLVKDISDFSALADAPK